MPDPTAGTITDHRTPPSGVLPRHTQTWLMVGIALAMLAIIVFTGRPQPPPARAGDPRTPAAPNPDRLRDYQERLRDLDKRVSQQTTPAPSPTLPVRDGSSEVRTSAPAADAMAADRRRREYDSLFASNVVVSRRPETERLAGQDHFATPARSGAGGTDRPPAPPSLDDVAEAVVRASTRTTSPRVPMAANLPEPTDRRPNGEAASSSPALHNTTTPAIDGPVHRLFEGTVIDAVLTNRLEGSVAAPVNCLVTNPVYAHDGNVVLIPAGARVLGETKPVQAFGETRLAVTFDRLVMPDGRTYALEHVTALNGIGDAGLHDRVDAHYASTFGTSAAVGLLSGFGQFLSGTVLSRASGTSPIVIAGGASEASTQATAQTMNRFLNRLPTVTIREGHRVKVYLTRDLSLPVYDARVAGRQDRSGDRP